MTREHRDTRWLLAAIQALIGMEWLYSGANKLLSGMFPSGLADTLSDGLKNNPNGWYVAFLQALVLPHSVFVGYLLEITEFALGIILVSGAILLLGQLPLQGERQHRTTVTMLALSAAAALIGAVFCVNFHFWMGDGMVPTVNPGRPFDEGINLDTLLPPLSLIVMVVQLRLISELTGGALLTRIRAALKRAVSIRRQPQAA